MTPAEQKYYRSEFISLGDFEHNVANKAEFPFAINIAALRDVAALLHAKEITLGIAFEEAHQRVIAQNSELDTTYTFTLRGAYDRRYLVIIYDNTAKESRPDWLDRLSRICRGFNDVQSETSHQVSAHPFGLFESYDTIAYVVPEATCYAYLCESGKQFFSALESLNNPEVNRIIQLYKNPIKIALDIQDVGKETK